MILAVVQVVFLVLTAWRLQAFDKTSHRYRPIVSFIATCWAGGCLAIAVSIILHWPEVIGAKCVLMTSLYGLGCGAAFYCGGNVASLLRRLHLIRY